MFLPALLVKKLSKLKFQKSTFLKKNFGQTRSSYVAIPFILRGCTATSIATGDYIAVMERSGQNEELACRNEERTKKKRSFVSSSGFNRCNSIPKHVNMILYDYFSVFYLSLALIFSTFLVWKIFMIFCFCYYLSCLFLTARTPLLSVWWGHKKFIHPAVLLCCVILDKHGTIP